MTEEVYILAIAALMPLTASLLLVQTNPYHALVIRGILGAVAALVYALFGAADVALTEALVGTMLSITLYAIAVRSSLRMQLGILETEGQASLAQTQEGQQLITTMQQAISSHHLRLELVPFSQIQDLQSALRKREVHATLVRLPEGEASDGPSDSASYQCQVRVQRLAELLDPQLSPQGVRLVQVFPEASVSPSPASSAAVDPSGGAPNLQMGGEA
ncbi:DUF4040 domain-containing protein [Lyngbya confervoides]|uniref:DUF4040 domain-containing protein n=1 Tax=Lyngbya confervoides BDU141951 TaxID=1574623 RepID=A0ABD4T084_9CYAN|nr:DUF4040 domain-containing protein [Lyngbya confervoides]MCM1982044.1 DUF4040 domain-containing protein [Lyngbya confervoides BDU141951]